MSAFKELGCDASCLPSSPQNVNTPGPEGVAGANGANGSDGINAFTYTTGDVLIPDALSNVASPVGVANSTWMALGQVIFISDGTNIAHFSVVAILSPTSVTLQFLGYTGDSAPGAVIATGATVSPSGTQPPPATPVVGQIIYYTGYHPTDPPTNTALPAIALKENGTGTMFVWNISTQAWNGWSGSLF